MQRDATAESTTPPAWPPWASGYLEALRASPNKSKAADIAGVDRATAWRLEQRDEQFKAAVGDALDLSLDLLEEVIFRRATSGMPVKRIVTRTLPDGKVETTITEDRHVSDTLAIFFLKRWRPEYRDSFRIDPDSAPLRVETVDAIDSAIARLRAELAAKAAGEPVPDEAAA